MVGPFRDQVLDLEKKLKKWLRREVGLVPGTHENCFTAKLEVNSLDELEAVSAVETDLFCGQPQGLGDAPPPCRGW